MKAVVMHAAWVRVTRWFFYNTVSVCNEYKMHNWITPDAYPWFKDVISHCSYILVLLSWFSNFSPVLHSGSLAFAPENVCIQCFLFIEGTQMLKVAGNVQRQNTRLISIFLYRNCSLCTEWHPLPCTYASGVLHLDLIFFTALSPESFIFVIVSYCYRIKTDL